MSRSKEPPPSVKIPDHFDRWMRIFYDRLTKSGEITIDQIDVAGFTELAQDAVGAALLDTAKIKWTYDDAGNHISADVPGLTVENGFEDSVPSTTSTLSFDNTTRTFTITPVSGSYIVWVSGSKLTISAPLSKQITDTEGIWYFYIDSAGALQATQAFDASVILINNAFVAVIYWDATNKIRNRFGDERHGRLMDSRTHAYLHATFHAQYSSGLALGNFSLDGNGDLAAHAEFSVANGVIYDEDLQHTITDGSPQDLAPIAQLPIFYRTGANGVWRFFSANDFPVIYGGRGAPATGARANYNQFTGGVWQLTEVANLNFLLTHVYTTNDLEFPVIVICGQNEYTTLANARDGAEVEARSLSLGGLVTLNLEFVLVGTVIWQSANAYGNTPKSRIRSLADGSAYVDWRFARPGGAPATALAAWGSITGTLSAQTDLQTVLTSLNQMARRYG